MKKCFVTIIKNSIYIFLCSVMVVVSYPRQVLAVDDCTESKLRDLKIAVLNCSDDDTCSTQQSSTPPSTNRVSPGGSIYLLGDSITVGNEAKYLEKFSQKQITAIINGSGSRSWKGAGIAGSVTANGSTKSASEAVNDDSSAIQAANGIVVALGSNGGTSLNPIEEVISTIRSKNPSAPIWWINTVGSNKYPRKLNYLGNFNKDLASAASSNNFAIIDWFKAVNPAGDPTITPTEDPNGFLDDGLHLTGSGKDTLANIVASSLTESSLNISTAPFQSSSQCVCTPNNSGINIGGSVSSSESAFVSWNSGIQPPYIMEQYVIEVLKYIADFKKVPRENVVTQEHVLAMLAWAWGEGGDIANSSVFNLYNTSALRNDPDATPYAAGGTDGRLAYKDFDTGIKATGGTILGGTKSQPDRYSRVWQALIDKNTSASDVLYAYSHYTKYPGNHWWAYQNEIDGEEKYYQKLTGYLNGIIKDYSRAATIIGTPEREQGKNMKDISKLQFDGTGAKPVANISSSGTSPSCNQAQNQGSGSNTDVVAVAEREFAAGAKESDGSYLKYTNGTNQPWCGWFASWVFREAGKPFSGGVGENGYAYPAVSSMHAMAKAKGWFKSASDAGFTPQPGDVAIFDEGKGSYPSHVNIVISYDATKKTYIAIGGNESSQVRKQEHSMSSTSLTGFMRVP